MIFRHLWWPRAKGSGQSKVIASTPRKRVQSRDRKAARGCEYQVTYTLVQV